MKEEFKIRTMGFGELAQMYNPSIELNSARALLRHWIKKHPSLGKQLIKSGYVKGQRILTPKQVEMIVLNLGDP